jgi:tetratricopeptide (TPR) repeat protein
MADPGGGETRNVISGGTQHVVLQGRDFRDVDIDVTIQAAAPVALAQLPGLVAEFTGRGSELAEITALLDPAGDARAVVVSAVAGLAGVGKTALTVQAAHAARKAGWFPGGVLFIDLHGYSDTPVQPAQALDALLRALGIAAKHIPPGAEERAGLYRSALAQISDPVLIIADNASSEVQVRPLLPGPGPHQVMVTSRHTLAGLEARLLDVTVLDDEAGVALLDQALRIARPDDNRIEDDWAGTTRLARICGGLPLALRITAALLKADPYRTVSDLSDELADDMRRLEALHYDDGSGTSALSAAAAFELSYRQLDEAAARVFRLLPVNPGPDVSTAAIAALADQPVSDARKLVSQLVKAHLVEVAPGTADRWRMHDLLRLYAQHLSDTHSEANEREQAQDRLLRYYLDTALAAGSCLSAPSGTPAPTAFTSRDSALAWLDAERPSLIAAVTTATSTRWNYVAALLPLTLAEYLSWRRRFDDLLTVSVNSRDAARHLGDRDIEAAALGNLGTALQEKRRFEEAISAHQDAAVIFRETGDRHGESIALGNLGNALTLARRFEEAISVQQDAVAIIQETGNRHGEGQVLNSLGFALREVGRFEEAISVQQDAVAIIRETGDRHGEGMALAGLGTALQQMGRFEEAISAHQDAAAIIRETGDRHGEGIALDSLGTALQQMGRFEEAIRAHQDAEAIYKETDDLHNMGMALGNLGTALREMGRFDEAISAHQDAAAIFRAIGDRHYEGNTLTHLGLALGEVSRFEEAINVYQGAAAIYRETGDRRGEGMALTNLGSALRDAGRFEEAITTCQDAVTIYRETGDRHGEAMALNNLGVALREVGQFEEGISAHQDAGTIFRETGDRHGEGIALDNLKSDRAAQGA